MSVQPAAALAAWAIFTAWLLLFFLLEPLDPVVGEELIDWIQAVCFVIMLFFYPWLRKGFAAWLAKAKT